MGKTVSNMKTIADVKKANKEAGSFFFDRKTMSFFNSKIESGLLKGKFFITSEQHGEHERAYTVREVQDDASIKTIGKFMGHKTKAAAKSSISFIH